MPASSKSLRISKTTLANMRVGVRDVWLLDHPLTCIKLHFRCVLQSLQLTFN